MEEITPYISYYDTIFMYRQGPTRKEFICPTGIADDEISLRRLEDDENNSYFTWFLFEVLPFEELDLVNAIGAAPALTGANIAIAPPKRLKKEVSYGDIIRLRHVSTNTFVNYSRRTPARREVGNVTLSLDPFVKGTDDATREKERTTWFRVVPKFKVRVEGQRVQNRDEIALESYEGKLWFHFAKNFVQLPDAEYCEVNLSTSGVLSSSVVVATYDPTGISRGVFNDPPNKRRIVSGQPIMLFHKEERGYLVASNPETLHYGTLDQQDAINHPSQQVMQLFGTFSIQNITDNELVHSLTKGMFVFEQGDVNYRGGIITWDKTVRIKHAASHQYLCVVRLSNTAGIPPDLPATFSKKYALRLTTNIRDDGTAFTVSSANMDAKDPNVRISSVFWLVSAMYRNAHIISAPGPGNVTIVGVSEKRRYRDSLEIREVGKLNDAMFVINSARACANYIDSWEHTTFPDEYILNGFTNVLVHLIQELVPGTSVLQVLTREASVVNASLQTMLVEQNIHEMLLTALDAPFREGNRQIEDMQKPELSKLNHISLLILRALQWIAKDNPHHASLLTNHVPFIYRFFGVGIGAAKCLMAIITDNESLAYKLKPEYVTFFTNEMKTKGRDEQYMRFLLSFVMCNGKAVRRSQGIVADILLAQNKDILLHSRRGPDSSIEVLIPPAGRNTAIRVDPQNPPIGWIWVTLKDLCIQEVYKPMRAFHEMTIEVLSALCLSANDQILSLAKPYCDETIALGVLSDVKHLPAHVVAVYIKLLRNVFVESVPCTDSRIRVLSDAGNTAPTPLLTQAASWCITFLNERIKILSADNNNSSLSPAVDKEIHTLVRNVLLLCLALLQRNAYSDEHALSEVLVRLISVEASGEIKPVTEDTKPHYDVKVTVCEILSVLFERQLDNVISKVMKEQTEISDDTDLVSLYKSLMVPSLTNTISADKKSVRTPRLLETLINLLQYPYPLLINRAAKLLFDIYTKPEKIADRLRTVVVIRTEDETTQYKKLEALCKGASSLLTASRLAAREMNKLTQDIGSMITVINQIPENVNMMQEIARFCEIHVSIHYFLSSHPVVDQAQLRPLLEAIVNLIKCFTHRHPKNQEAVFKYVPLFLQECNVTNLVHALVSIFEDNHELISQISEEVVTWFLLKCIEVRQPIYMNFLCNICMLQGFPMERNIFLIQRVVNVRKLDKTKLFVFSHCDTDPVELEQRNARLIDRDYFKNPEGVIRYHMQVLRFFGICAQAGGVSGIGLTNAVKYYTDKGLPLYFRLGYLRLVSALLENDDIYNELFRDVRIVAFFQTVGVDISTPSASSNDPQSHDELCGSVAVDLLYNIFTKPRLPNIEDALFHRAIQGILNFLEKSAPVSALGRCIAFVKIVPKCSHAISLPPALHEQCIRVKHALEDLNRQDVADKENDKTPVQKILNAWVAAEWYENGEALSQLAEQCSQKSQAASIQALARAFVKGDFDLENTKSLMHLLALCIPMEDEDLSEEQQKANDQLRGQTQELFNELSVTNKMLINVEHKDSKVRASALLLGINMLHGGCAVVQERIYNIFMASIAETFFVRTRQILSEYYASIRAVRRAQAEHNYSHKIDIVGISRIFRFLQLLCEGHNSKLQNYLRDQPDNLISVNLIKETIVLVRYIMKQLDVSLLDLAEQGLATLQEYCQGPCKMNQLVIVEYNVGHIVRDILELEKNDSEEEEKSGEPIEEEAPQEEGAPDRNFTPTMVNQLLKSAIGVLLSVTEGIQKNSVIPDKLRDNEVRDILMSKMNDAWILSTIDHLNKEDHGLIPFQIPGIGDKKKEEEEDECNFHELGICIFMYLMTLSRFDKTGETDQLLRRNMSYGYYYSALGQIEIARSKQVEKVYFEIPEEYNYIPEETKEDIHIEVNRDTTATKQQDFFARWDDVMEEAKIYFETQKSANLRVFAQNKDRLADLSLLVSIVLSLFLLFSMRHAYDKDTEFMAPSEFVAFRVLGVLQIFMEFWMFFGWVGLRGRIMVTRYVKQKVALVAKAKQQMSQFEYTQILIRYQTEILYNDGEFDSNKWLKRGIQALFLFFQTEFHISVLFASAAPLGLFVHPVFYSVQVFRIIERSDSLQNVVKAVTLKWTDLAQTAFLGSVVVFIFSMISFYYFDTKYYDINANPGFGLGFSCQELVTCFANNVIYGLRGGGGIGDFLQPPDWTKNDGMVGLRLTFDFVYWLIMIIIFLNIIFGIILDTFADLRDKKQAREVDQRTTCFICGIEAFVFDKVSSFHQHYKNEHNMWMYLAFRIHLENKDETDHNGQESYVFEKCARKDTSFFPTEQAICLEGRTLLDDDDGDDEEEREKLMMNLITSLKDLIEMYNRKYRLHTQGGAGLAKVKRTMTMINPQPTQQTQQVQQQPAIKEFDGMSLSDSQSVPSVILAPEGVEILEDLDQHRHALSDEDRDNILTNLMSMIQSTARRVDSYLEQETVVGGGSGVGTVATSLRTSSSGGNDSGRGQRPPF